MTGKKPLGLKNGESGDGTVPPVSEAAAPPGGGSESGSPSPANAAAPANRRGGRRGDSRGQAAGGKDAQQKSGEDTGTTGDCDGIAQLRHLVSELVTGAEKKTASKLARLEKQGKTLAENAEANAIMLRQLVERQPGAGGGSEAAAEEATKLLERIGIHAADFGRWVELERRGRRWWWALATAAGFPAFLLLGLLAEQQFQVIPPPRLHRRLARPRLGAVWTDHCRLCGRGDEDRCRGQLPARGAQAVGRMPVRGTSPGARCTGGRRHSGCHTPPAGCPGPGAAGLDRHLFVCVRQSMDRLGGNCPIGLVSFVPHGRIPTGATPPAGKPAQRESGGVTANANTP